MTTVAAPVRESRAWSRVLWLAVAAVLVVAPYLAGVVLPYFVNDLHQLPLSEVASGRHDPKDLWPQGFVGGLIQLGGYLSIGATPVGLIFVGAGSGALAVRGLLRGRRSSLAAVLCLALLCLACAVGLAWFLGPTSAALATWRAD